MTDHFDTRVHACKDTPTNDPLRLPTQRIPSSQEENNNENNNPPPHEKEEMTRTISCDESFPSAPTTPQDMLRDYLTEIRSRVDASGDLMVSFPDNYDTVVNLMTRSDLLQQTTTTLATDEKAASRRSSRHSWSSILLQTGSMTATPQDLDACGDSLVSSEDLTLACGIATTRKLDQRLSLIEKKCQTARSSHEPLDHNRSVFLTQKLTPTALLSSRSITASESSPFTRKAPPMNSSSSPRPPIIIPQLRFRPSSVTPSESKSDVKSYAAHPMNFIQRNRETAMTQSDLTQEESARVDRLLLGLEEEDPSLIPSKEALVKEEEEEEEVSSHSGFVKEEANDVMTTPSNATTREEAIRLVEIDALLQQLRPTSCATARVCSISTREDVGSPLPFPLVVTHQPQGVRNHGDTTLERLKQTRASDKRLSEINQALEELHAEDKEQQSQRMSSRRSSRGEHESLPRPLSSCSSRVSTLSSASTADIQQLVLSARNDITSQEKGLATTEAIQHLLWTLS